MRDLIGEKIKKKKHGMCQTSYSVQTKLTNASSHTLNFSKSVDFVDMVLEQTRLDLYFNYLSMYTPAKDILLTFLYGQTYTPAIFPVVPKFLLEAVTVQSIVAKSKKIGNDVIAAFINPSFFIDHTPIFNSTPLFFNESINAQYRMGIIFRNSSYANLLAKKNSVFTADNVMTLPTTKITMQQRSNLARVRATFYDGAASTQTSHVYDYANLLLCQDFNFENVVMAVYNTFSTQASLFVTSQRYIPELQKFLFLLKMPVSPTPANIANYGISDATGAAARVRTGLQQCLLSPLTRNTDITLLNYLEILQDGFLGDLITYLKFTSIALPRNFVVNHSQAILVCGTSMVTPVSSKKIMVGNFRFFAPSGLSSLVLQMCDSLVYNLDLSADSDTQFFWHEGVPVHIPLIQTQFKPFVNNCNSASSGSLAETASLFLQRKLTNNHIRLIFQNEIHPDDSMCFFFRGRNSRVLSNHLRTYA